MKIGYVTTYNSADVKQWSGLGYFISKALSDSGISVQRIGELEYKPSLSSKIKVRITNSIGLKADTERDASLLKNYASEISNRLDEDVDWIFAPSSLPVAYIKSSKPIAIYVDATFQSMVNFYPEYNNYPASTLKRINKLEKRALDNARVLFFASDWAARSAVEHYDIDPSKVFVVPFGANLETTLPEECIDNIIAERDQQILKLLFIGVDWERKGGSKVLALAEQIKKMGVEVELHVAGPKSNPIASTSVSYHYHGFLNKHNAGDAARLDNLFRSCHFFVMPSISECYGLVYCEANAFGMPVIGNNVGGVPTIIESGINGFLLDPQEELSVAARLIADLFKDRKRYVELAKSSFRSYTNKLNWTTAGRTIKSVLEKQL